MSGIERRGLLKAGLGLGAGAVALPAWSSGLARATDDGSAALQAALKGARDVGKPLLVLLIPTGGDAYARMQMWSELLAVAEDATLAELALCEVICAQPPDLVVVGTGATHPALGADDVAVLLETDGRDGRVVGGAGLPELVNAHRDGTGEKRYDASARARAAELARRVRAAILPDAEALARRVAASEASFDMQTRMQVVLAHEPRPRLSHLDRGAAIVLADARGEPDARRAREKEANLARAALQRLWEEAPVGAKWSSSSGYCPPCGMGYTPEISRHFLSLLAR